jgi:hypothetical protein
VRGRTEPRLWTPPLRDLTPETSFGFDVIEFARDVLRFPLDPWQQWLVIHGGELLPDGRPRFKVVHVQVARQNGKTQLLVVLALYWQVVERVPMVLGTSTKIDYAKESWTKSVKLAERAPGLRGIIPRRRRDWTRQANGEQESWITDPDDPDADDARYKIAAANEEGGRSLTIHRLILDELRQHHDTTAWDAAVPAGNAVRNFQAWCPSNAGTDRSVVLNAERAAALRFLETGEGDYRTGWFEWSSPPGSEPTDLAALAYANPTLGTRMDPDSLLSDARKAVAAGGEKLAGFVTEVMCLRVRHLDPAIDPAGWKACAVPGDLSGARSRVALCLDVAPDSQHATLAAAAVLEDGRTRVDIVAAWSGAGCTRQLVADLPGHVAKVRPQALGWFPEGPAAAVAGDVADRKGRPWPPAGVTVEAIRAEVPAVCMGLAEQVTAGQLLHAGDPLLDAHAAAAEKLRTGDAWRFSRKGDGHVDALYAAAGAVHLARTLPKPIGRPRIITARRASPPAQLT